jgi:hypothetical protein
MTQSTKRSRYDLRSNHSNEQRIGDWCLKFLRHAGLRFFRKVSTGLFFSVLLTMTGCTQLQSPSNEIFEFDMPICSTRSSDGDKWPAPYYEHSVRLKIPEKNLYYWPTASTDFPANAIPKRKKNEPMVVDSLQFVNDRVVNQPNQEPQSLAKMTFIILENHPKNIAESVKANSSAFLLEKFAGYRDGMVVMKENLRPPEFRKPEPENGFWIWEAPQKWIIEGKGIIEDKDMSYHRTYQPVGFEDKIVFSCNHWRGMPVWGAASCRVSSQLDTGIGKDCGRISLQYRIWGEKLQNWREIDADMRSKIIPFIQSPLTVVKTIDGKQ